MANTGYKIYLNRRRLILDPSGTIFYNGLTWSSDLTEPNSDVLGNPILSGIGPYFSPSYDITSCPVGVTGSPTILANLSFSWDKNSGEFIDISSSINGSFNYIDWGDGTINTTLSHTYLSTNNFTVRIYNSDTTILILGNKLGSSVYKLTSITSIPTTVTYLYLSTNSLTTIPGLSSLTGLTELYIINNSLTSLDFSTNTLLSVVLVSGNSISGTQNISTNTSLTWLEIQSNQITSITGVVNCTSLGILQFDNNQIDVTDINNALIALDTNGLSNGVFTSDIQTPSATPTGAGASAKTSLISKSWTVITD